MQKIKLIFFDMEGTVFKKATKPSNLGTTSAWGLLSENLGPQALASQTKGIEMWINKEFPNYIAWVEYCIDFFKRENITKKIFIDTLNSIDFQPGVKETFKALQEKGYRTALISGGFIEQSRRAQQELKIDHAMAAVELFWNKDGTLNHWNVLPMDFEGKVDFMHLMIKELNLKKEECAFVGDGTNDIHLAKQVGLSIAFNGSEALQKATTHQINQEEPDFRAILEYFQ